MASPVSQCRKYTRGDSGKVRPPPSRTAVSLDLRIFFLCDTNQSFSPALGFSPAQNVRLASSLSLFLPPGQFSPPLNAFQKCPDPSPAPRQLGQHLGPPDRARADFPSRAAHVQESSPITNQTLETERMRTLPPAPIAERRSIAQAGRPLPRLWRSSGTLDAPCGLQHSKVRESPFDLGACTRVVTKLRESQQNVSSGAGHRPGSTHVRPLQPS